VILAFPLTSILSPFEQGEGRTEDNRCTKADNQGTLALMSKALD